MFTRALRPLAAVFFAAAVACSGGKVEQSQPAASAAGAPKVDQASAGVVAGRVVFEGAPPANPVVRPSGDPACTREHPDGLVLENYVVQDGGLDNVFVYVKSGLGN